MVLPTALASINQAAVAAAKAGRHEDALALYSQLFQQLKERHLSHPQLFVTHSNKAASHLALGQHAAALQDAKACLELLTTASASQGLLSPSRHPHWPKACLRLGQAFAGLQQHTQAAAAFEAGLGADPLNPALKAGLQQAQQGVAADLLSGKTLTHVKALPAPQTPERITLVPHNNTKGVRGPHGSDSGSSRVQRRGHAVGWHAGGDAAARLLSAAESVQHAVQAAEASEGTALSDLATASVLTAGMVAAAGGSQLPKLLLTPAAAAADVGLRDVYEYLTTQCAIRAPKQYLYRILPDNPRMAAWWDATTAAVQAVRDSGRTPRVLLLGAKAGVLAVAALRAGAAHVTCVESSPYLAAACSQVLADNGFTSTTHATICTPSLSALRIGPTAGVDVPNVCNCLVADLLDDGILSGGLIPAVANALEELLVREQPALVPQQVSVIAQAVGVRPSVVEVPLERSGQGGRSGSSGGSDGSSGGGTMRLDLTALDAYRWTPSQALPSPLDPDTFTPLSAPKPVWHIPLADVAADRSAVQHLDFESTASGTWCAVALWAELQLYGDITLSTAGPWNSEVASGSTTSHSPRSAASGASGSSSQHSQAAADAPQHTPATGPAVPLLLTCPSWDSQDTPDHSSACAAASASAGASEPSTLPPETAAAATGPSTDPASLTAPNTPVFKAPPSQQPAVCWLPGGLPVSAGDIFPVVASHNTIRCLFTLQEADYSFLFCQEPSFPHSHFSMTSDTQRLQAYAAALRAALARAAAQKQEQRALGDTGTAPVHSPVPDSTSSGKGQLAGGGTDPQRLDLAVLDIGCGSGVLSLLAAAALCPPPSHSPVLTAAVPAAQAVLQLDHSPPVDSVDAVGLTATTAPAADTVPVEHNVSVVGVELTAPLAAVAQRAVAANGAAGAVSIVQADAGSCRRGQQVPPGGVNVIVLDLFDAGLVGHGVLGLVEAAKASLAAEGAQVVPASATLYCMGVQLLTVNSWRRSDSEGGAQEPQQQQQQDVRAQDDAGRVDLRALDAYRWSDNPDTVLLHHLPHKPLTAPVKLGDFDFCAPAGTPYPKEMQARLEAVASGRLDALVVWFDLHLAEGVTVTSAPEGYTTGGRTSNSSARHTHQQHHWGQTLHYLDAVLPVSPGDEVQLGALREGPRLSFAVLDATCANSSSSVPATQDATVFAGSASSISSDESSTPEGKAAGSSAAAGSAQQEQEAAGSAGVLMHPVPRPPWLRPGAGIEDPAVWSVKKCQQLLGQMLLRAAGAKFPPIWKDVQLMQLHAGSLGLCAATVGVVTQELTMREALAVAGQQQLAVSPFALPEAAGMQPPVIWR